MRDATLEIQSDAYRRDDAAIVKVPPPMMAQAGWPVTSQARNQQGDQAMMPKKIPIDPARLRVIPPSGFSWIDRRFIRDGFLDRLPTEASLLYFFLAAVSDAEGLSFYSDPTIAKLLRLDHEQIEQARARLVSAQLILYRYPLYQVLPLPKVAHETFEPRAKTTERGGEPMLLGEILKRVQACKEQDHGNAK